MNDLKDITDNKYMDHIFKKFVGFVYFGCCGIKELHNTETDIANSNSNTNELLKEFSLKYGILIYLREELAFLKNKSYEYYVSI